MTAPEFYSAASGYPLINPFAATCQSAHETGWWTSLLWVKARNGAGIKADRTWIKKGLPAMSKSSPEEVRGKLVSRVSYFRLYNSTHEFLADYQVKISANYPRSVKNSDTVWGYFSGLQKGRYGSWATTQRYFEHLADKAVRLGPVLLGVEWRRQLMDDYKTAKSRGLLSPKESEIVIRKLLAVGAMP